MFPSSHQGFVFFSKGKMMEHHSHPEKQKFFPNDEHTSSTYVEMKHQQLPATKRDEKTTAYFAAVFNVISWERKGFLL